MKRKPKNISDLQSKKHFNIKKKEEGELRDLVLCEWNKLLSSYPEKRLILTDKEGLITSEANLPQNSVYIAGLVHEHKDNVEAYVISASHVGGSHGTEVRELFLTSINDSYSSQISVGKISFYTNFPEIMGAYVFNGNENSPTFIIEGPYTTIGSNYYCTDYTSLRKLAIPKGGSMDPNFIEISDHVIFKGIVNVNDKSLIEVEMPVPEICSKVYDNKLYVSRLLKGEKDAFELPTKSEIPDSIHLFEEERLKKPGSQVYKVLMDSRGHVYESKNMRD